MILFACALLFPAATPVIRNITIRDLNLQSGSFMNCVGLSDAPIEGILLDNVQYISICSLAPLFFKRAQTLDLRYGLLPAALVPRFPTNARLGSRICIEDDGPPMHV